MARTARAPVDFKLPTGRQMSSGSVVIEDDLNGVNQEHYDTPHAWAMMINSMYEYMKPTVITDAPSIPWTSSGVNTYQEIGRYKVPLFQVGTGDASEGIMFAPWYKVAGGDSGKIRVTTPLGSYESGALASAGMAWGAVTTAGIDDSLVALTDSAEVIVEAKCTANGANISIYAMEAYWYRGSPTLPGVLYDVAFIPMDGTELSAEGRGLHVEQMLRMAKDLGYLKRHRTPGPILQTAYRSPFVIPDGFAGNVQYTLARTIAYQPEGVTTARVWFYGSHAGAGDGKVTVEIGDQIRAGGTAQATIPAALGWAYCDVVLPVHHGPTRALEVRITSRTINAGMQGGNNITVKSISGWWLTIPVATGYGG
jgi:hypothetical protein